MSSSTILPPEPRSGRLARSAVRELCARGDVSVTADDVDTAVLLATELVSNAVLHARTSSVLDAAIQDGTLRVSVTDRSRELPKPATVTSPTAATGRGLLLVSRLADRWGYRASRSGRPLKSVWFELDVA